MMKKSRQGIAPGEYYHVYNRGSNRAAIFTDKAERQRFLFNLLYLQSPVSFRNVNRTAGKYDPVDGFPVDPEITEEILKNRYVELTAFCLMPNHFHLLVKELEEGGLATYMHRVAVGYAKYFGEKHEQNGHVFQGSYKSVPVKDNRQLLHLSAYIHKNPHELSDWKGREFEYPWSSLQDFTTANRWGGLIVPDIIVEQFEQTKNSNYADFVKSSTAKTLKDELGDYPLL
jgi:putative transposase